MFNLIVNNKEVELPADAGISLSITNPAFDPEMANRVFTLSLSANITPANAAIFGQLDRLDLKTRKRKFPATLIIGKTVNFEGRVKVRRATSYSLTRNNKIEINFQSNGVDFYERMKDVLWEDVLPSIPTRLTDPDYYRITPVNQNSSFSPGAIYRVTINGQEFVEILDDSEPYSYFVDQLNDQINAVHPGLSQVEILGFNLYTIKLDPVVLPLMTIEVSNDLVLSYPGDSPLNNQNLFIDFVREAIEQPREDISFPTHYNPEFYGDPNRYATDTSLIAGDEELYRGVVNPYRNFVYPNSEFFSTSSKPFHHTYVPFLRMKYLFKKSLKAAGYYENIAGEFWTSEYLFDSDPSPLTLYNTHALDYFERVEAGNSKGYLNTGSRIINLADHVPYEDAKELFLDFCEFFQTYIDVEGDTVSFKSIKTQFEQPPYDFTDLIEDEVQITSESYDGYDLNYEKDEIVFTEKENDVHGVSVQPAELEIKTQVSTLAMRTIGVTLVEEEVTMRLPVIKQRGNSEAAGVVNNPTGPKYIFDYGRMPDPNGDMVSYGSSDNIMPDGSVNTDDFTLLWQDEKGLLNQHWGIIPELLTGREVQVQARLSEALINEISKWNRSAVTIRSPKGQIKAYIKSLNIQVTRNTIKPATVTLAVPTTS